MNAVEGRGSLRGGDSGEIVVQRRSGPDNAMCSFFASNDTIVSDAAPVAPIAEANDGMHNGLALWVQPMYQSVRADGLRSGNFSYGYDTDIYGASLGADYTVHNNMRFGLALHVGGGQSESSGSEFSHTKNDFDFVGTSLYASYLYNNFVLSANIGYTVTANDVNQDTILDNVYTDDFDTAVFNVGARAEYRIKTDFMDIITYIGARLNYFSTDSFDVKTATETVYQTAESHATPLAIPLGVTLSKDMTFGGVNFVPWASLGVQCTMGDLDVAQKISMPGVTGSERVESEIFEPVTFMGGLGFDVNVNDVTFGLEYNLGASEHVMSHQLSARVRYAF